MRRKRMWKRMWKEKKEKKEKRKWVKSVHVHHLFEELHMCVCVWRGGGDARINARKSRQGGRKPMPTASLTKHHLYKYSVCKQRLQHSEKPNRCVIKDTIILKVSCMCEVSSRMCCIATCASTSTRTRVCFQKKEKRWKKDEEKKKMVHWQCNEHKVVWSHMKGFDILGRSSIKCFQLGLKW